MHQHQVMFFGQQSAGKSTFFASLGMSEFNTSDHKTIHLQLVAENEDDRDRIATEYTNTLLERQVIDKTEQGDFFPLNIHLTENGKTSIIKTMDYAGELSNRLIEHGNRDTSQLERFLKKASSICIFIDPMISDKIHALDASSKQKILLGTRQLIGNINSLIQTQKYRPSIIIAVTKSDLIFTLQEQSNVSEKDKISFINNLNSDPEKSIAQFKDLFGDGLFQSLKSLSKQANFSVKYISSLGANPIEKRAGESKIYVRNNGVPIGIGDLLVEIQRQSEKYVSAQKRRQHIKTHKSNYLAILMLVVALIGSFLIDKSTVKDISKQRNLYLNKTLTLNQLETSINNAISLWHPFIYLAGQETIWGALPDIVNTKEIWSTSYLLMIHHLEENLKDLDREFQQRSQDKDKALDLSTLTQIRKKFAETSFAIYQKLFKLKSMPRLMVQYKTQVLDQEKRLRELRLKIDALIVYIFWNTSTAISLTDMESLVIPIKHNFMRSFEIYKEEYSKSDDVDVFNLSYSKGRCRYLQKPFNLSASVLLNEENSSMVAPLCSECIELLPDEFKQKVCDNLTSNLEIWEDLESRSVHAIYPKNITALNKSTYEKFKSYLANASFRKSKSSTLKPYYEDDLTSFTQWLNSLNQQYELTIKFNITEGSHHDFINTRLVNREVKDGWGTKTVQDVIYDPPTGELKVINLTNRSASFSTSYRGFGAHSITGKIHWKAGDHIAIFLTNKTGEIKILDTSFMSLANLSSTTYKPKGIPFIIKTDIPSLNPQSLLHPNRVKEKLTSKRKKSKTKPPRVQRPMNWYCTCFQTRNSSDWADQTLCSTSRSSCRKYALRARKKYKGYRLGQNNTNKCIKTDKARELSSLMPHIPEHYWDQINSNTWYTMTTCLLIK